MMKRSASSTRRRKALAICVLSAKPRSKNRSAALAHGLYRCKTKTTEAIENTRIAAVSAGTTGNLRVYCQDKQNLLRVSLWNTEGRYWGPSDVVEDTFVLAPNAPISAVCWYANNTDRLRDLRIYLYTIMQSNPKETVELVRNGEDWNSNPEPIATICTSILKTSAVAVSRNNRANDTNPISVFYQHHPKVINLASADTSNIVSAAEKEALEPEGIPTSRGLLGVSIPAFGSADRVVEQLFDDMKKRLEARDLNSLSSLMAKLNGEYRSSNQKSREELRSYVAKISELEAKLQAETTALTAERNTVAALKNERVSISCGSGLLTANELAKFDFPMTEKLRNLSEAEHREYAVHWNAAWLKYQTTFVKHGRGPGLQNWDISELGDVVSGFANCKSLFLPRAEDTDWNRYWDGPNFECCFWIYYQRDLWKAAKARKLPDSHSLSNEAWEQVLQNFSIFLWHDFFVMIYDFKNGSRSRFPSTYSTAISF